jgi:hypothetical protein
MRMEIGIQAIGGIGLIASTTGPNIQSTILYRPIAMPKGTAVIIAKMNPRKTRNILKLVCSINVLPSVSPSKVSFMNASAISISVIGV